MRKKFVEAVGNVKKFSAALKRLEEITDNVPRMMLVYSDPGLGKTSTIAWYVANHRAAFVRAKSGMTQRWLLHEVVSELGEHPTGSVMKLYHQAQELLASQRMPLIIDEVDHLCHSTTVIETLRDLHDMTDAPVVLVGMGQVDKRLMPHRHLWSRLTEVLKFEPLSADDLREAFSAMNEVEVGDDVVAAIHAKLDGKVNFRELVKLIRRMEYFAKINSIKTLSTSDLARIEAWR